MLALASCSGPTDPDSRVTALFEVPRVAGEGDFYALPYPNDLRVDADGRIDLSAHQRPNALTDEYLEAINANQLGFSLNAPVLFRFSAELDISTLPSTPAASTEESASVYLINIESGSERNGERIPCQFRFDSRSGTVIGDNWLSVLPFPGFPLEEGARYAAIVTDRVLDQNGESIAPGSEFLEMRDPLGDNQASDAVLEAARARYATLWDYLDLPGGDERPYVVSATIFTTQSETVLMAQIRSVIYRDTPQPTPRGLVEGAGAGAELAVYEGVYDGPIFQAGTIPYSRPESGGNIEFDASGDPIIQSMVELRFAVTTPTTTVPSSGWPVVIYAHGTGGSYRSFISNGTAAALAAEGIAAISIDQTLHGPRNPDGDEEIDFFNFQNPLSARDNTIQGALDDFQLARMVVGFNEVVGANTITFDSDRIYFFGHSQGGLTGLPFVAYEPLIKGAVFSGAGGNIVLSLLNKTEPIDIAGLLKILIRDEPLDEFNPMLGLIQGYLDRSDSVNFGPLINTRPPEGRSPIDVFHSLGVTDNFTPVPSIKALSTSLGVAPLNPLIESIEGLEIRGLAPVDAPITGNISGVTGVVGQYNAAPGSDGHFVLFDIASARRQSIQFLATLATNGVATVVTPE